MPRIETRPLTVVLHGTDLPGSAFTDEQGQGYAAVHVGVQRGTEVVDLVPADADSAEWSFEVAFAPGPPPAFRGPYVHGRGTERFLYLNWGAAVPGGGHHMFRRAKLRLDGIPDAVVAQLAGATRLRGRSSFGGWRRAAWPDGHGPGPIASDALGAWRFFRESG